MKVGVGRIVVGALLLASPAAAQPVNLPCGGTVVVENESSQLGSNLWLVYTVRTAVPPNICVFSVATEAHVAGKLDSGLYREGTWSATAQRQVPVDYAGLWTTLGSHWFWAFLPFCRQLFAAGLTQSTAMVIAYNSPSKDCADLGADYYWDGFQCVYTPGSPILIDVGGKGYKLTSVEEGVLFDIDGDGQAEQIAWTQADADNAFLAFDRNANGRIDDGTELFGSYTPTHPGGDMRLTSPNGFEALRFIESPFYGALTPSDGVIDARDAMFARLVLWTDRNHNGISEPEELCSLSDAGIVSIATDYKTVGRRDRYGNEFRQKGRLTWADGEVAPVYDVWFAVRR